MKWIDNELRQLQQDSLERTIRSCRTISGAAGNIEREGRTLLNLSSNDYLGLSGHPAIIDAMRASLLADGAGAGASRLVTGSRPVYEKLELALAEWQGCEAALVFANGYMANAGTIGALAGRDGVVFSDKLNHASITDGIVFSRAQHARYRHNDMDHLKSLLTKYRDKQRKLIVTDAMFSMDGDQARLHELVELKREFGAMLMVDEAHSGGIYGSEGEGLCRQLGVHGEVDIHMGTFSKAFGVYGAYICGSRQLIRLLVNKSRPLIYSTALPPSVPAGIEEALRLVQSQHWRREKLLAASRSFRSALGNDGFQIGGEDSPIVPLVVGDNGTALRFSAELESQGIAAVAIRPPTVPAGTARIRFSLSAAHSEQELESAASSIRKIGLRLGVISG